jgi:phosphoribosylamine--glycine ligase
MKIVVVGSGGREHAIALQLARSPRVSQVISAPGNPGMARLGACWPALTPSNFAEFVQRCRDESVAHVVIGPEAPLVDGLADLLRAAGIPCFGPNSQGAMLEGSKAFAKDFMQRHGIPTARSSTLDREDQIDAALADLPERVVVKASGLAAGKGVILCDDHQQAAEVTRGMLQGALFGESGRTVVIEEMMEGPEVSILAVVNGMDALLLPPAQDHKPLGDGNTGPNTGGMGAFCPGTFTTPEDLDLVRRTIVEPSLEGLVKDGIDYSGVLYVGIMWTQEGPRVLEYNCRLGDPETQPVLLRMKSDLVDLLEATSTSGPSSASIQWDPRSALCLVLASDGYPDSPRKGQVIEGDLFSEVDDDVQVFHAGTRLDESGNVAVSGGRVLGVTALGDDLEEARNRAYARADQIHFDGKIHRTDIGEYRWNAGPIPSES